MLIQKRIKQINLTENLDQARNTTMFCFIIQAEETILNFQDRIVKVL